MAILDIGVPEAATESNLLEDFKKLRERTLSLCSNLSAEDMTVQSMPDASPTKWHLAHTTWFFEQFILSRNHAYKPFNSAFDELFNSYYVSVGQPHTRAHRGLLTRPGLEEVLAYRRFVDEHIAQLAGDQQELDLITVGLHHEMQHQELMLTDVLHLFSRNPTHPKVCKPNNIAPAQNAEATPLQWLTYDGGMVEVGAPGGAFSYDCEKPRHSHYLRPYQLAKRCITNAEWLEFIADGGYREPLLWLADGWAQVQSQQWQAPQYWLRVDEQWQQFGLNGLKALDLAAPVVHISYYEAQAFAQWSGKRLPFEHELEYAAAQQSVQGNFCESQLWRPQRADFGDGIQQLYGDVWEWTQSPFLPYPGFSAEQGALGEYNGKFMCNQFVLRGGSCVTPQMQLRSSYRNFFYPHQRWQFSGLRLASYQ